MPEKECHHPNTGTHIYRRLWLIFHIKKKQPNPSQKAKRDKEEISFLEIYCQWSSRSFFTPSVSENNTLLMSISLSEKVSKLARWLSGQESACQCRQFKRLKFNPCVEKISWRRKWQPTPLLLPEKSHGQRSMAGCSPQDRRVRHNWACVQSAKQKQDGMLLFLSCWERELSSRTV